MKTKTCKDCRHFTHYSDGDPDGRCAEGCGTYCTHTRGDEKACAAFQSKDIHILSTRQLGTIEEALRRAKCSLMIHCRYNEIRAIDHALLIINHIRKNEPET